jgi:hypothetical protein
VDFYVTPSKDNVKMNIKSWFWICIKILPPSHKLPITFSFYVI